MNTDHKLSFNVSHRITPEGNPEVTTTTLVGDVVTKVSQHVADLQEKAIREALISLGWTPPRVTQLEIWINNPNSRKGWVRHSGPFTSMKKTEKRVRDIKLFDSVKGCRFSIREVPRQTNS